MEIYIINLRETSESSRRTWEHVEISVDENGKRMSHLIGDNNTYFYFEIKGNELKVQWTRKSKIVIMLCYKASNMYSYIHAAFYLLEEDLIKFWDRKTVPWVS